MNNIKSTITTPYFETRLNKWVYRGYELVFENIGTFMFLHLMSMHGHKTDWAEIKCRWNLFKISDDGKLEDMTMNGIEHDANFMEGDIRESVTKRKGLSVEDIKEMYHHAKEHTLTPEQAAEAFKEKIQPGIVKDFSAIEEKMTILNELSHEELSALAEDINILMMRVKSFYPRSYELLLGIKLTVRERYAEVKYPELYEELKKLHTDKDYKTDANDMIVGFGPRIVLNLFYTYFKSTSEGEYESYQIRSPFEKYFGKSVLTRNAVEA